MANGRRPEVVEVGAHLAQGAPGAGRPSTASARSSATTADVRRAARPPRGRAARRPRVARARARSSTSRVAPSAVARRPPGRPTSRSTRGGRVGRAAGAAGRGRPRRSPRRSRTEALRASSGRVTSAGGTRPAYGAHARRHLPDDRGRTAYRGPVDRSPAFLAALASAAVPGLDPVSVEALPSTADQSFDVAFVQDAEHRRWVVRAPRTDVAGAEMDRTVAAAGAARAPAAVRGAGAQGVRRAHRGRPRGGLPLPARAQPRLRRAARPAPASPPSSAAPSRPCTTPTRPCTRRPGCRRYDADAYRTRRLAELDRAAETGRVPTTLLTRWETALEDVTLWRFAPTADPRRPHRRPGARGVHRRRRRLDRQGPGDDRLGGRQGRRPRRRLRGAGRRRRARGGRDRARGLRARPGRAPRPPTCSCAPAWSPSSGLLGDADGRPWPARTSAPSRCSPPSCAGSTTPCTPSEEPDDYRRTSLAPVGPRRRTARPPALVVDDDDEDLPEVADDDRRRGGRPTPRSPRTTATDAEPTTRGRRRRRADGPSTRRRRPSRRGRVPTPSRATRSDGRADADEPDAGDGRRRRRRARADDRPDDAAGRRGRPGDRPRSTSGRASGAQHRSDLVGARAARATASRPWPRGRTHRAPGRSGTPRTRAHASR